MVSAVFEGFGFQVLEKSFRNFRFGMTFLDSHTAQVIMRMAKATCETLQANLPHGVF